MSEELVLRIDTHKPVQFSLPSGDTIRLRSLMSVEDMEFLSSCVQEKAIGANDFAVKVLDHFTMELHGNELSSWNVDALVSLSRQWSASAFPEEVTLHEINSLDDFHIVISLYLKRLGKHIAQGLKDVQTSAKKLLQVVTENFSFQLKALLDTLAKIDFQEIRDAGEIEKRIASTEYELAPFIIDPYEFLKANLGSVDNDVTEKLISITTGTDFFVEMEKRFDKPILNKRWEIVKQALDAHQKGQYALSVPVFIAQMEGIFTDWLLAENIVFRKENDMVPFIERTGEKAKKLNSLGVKIIETKQFFEDDPAYNLVVNTVLYRNVSERNSILHGENVAYMTPKKSVQTLLLVYVLADFIDYEIKTDSSFQE